MALSSRIVVTHFSAHFFLQRGAIYRRKRREEQKNESGSATKTRNGTTYGVTVRSHEGATGVLQRFCYNMRLLFIADCIGVLRIH